MRRRPKNVGEKCNSIIEKGLITYTQGTHMHMHNYTHTQTYIHTTQRSPKPIKTIKTQ